MTTEPQQSPETTPVTEEANAAGPAVAVPPPESVPGEASSAAAGEAAPADGEESSEKLHQTIAVRDVGPCKKHVKVTIDRADIEDRLDEKFSEMVADSIVPGFRPGKAPRRVVERRFGKEVGEQVKTEVLLASLQQLGDEANLAPLSAPNLDPTKIVLPAEGPLVYEFEVEVRPDFELPSYRGLRLRRPVHAFTDEEVANEERRLLAPHGQIVPKPDGKAELGDIIVADVTTKLDGRVMTELKEAQFSVEKQLAFKDGLAPRFYQQVKGASAGDTRVVDIELSTQVADPSLRGRTVQAFFDVKDIKSLRLPELTPAFCQTFGVHSAEELHEVIGVILKRRLQHTQRQSARAQVIEKIAAASSWQLPEDLLARQARNALNRKAMELRADGIADGEITSRLRVMQQDVLRSTALALKEHFVLQKIAEVEKIDVGEADINDEIERLAVQADESPRRLRARLEREDMLEALAAEMIERKVLDLILDSAQYDDYELVADEEAVVSTVESQVVPGTMQDPTALPEASSEQPAEEKAGTESKE